MNELVCASLASQNQCLQKIMKRLSAVHSSCRLLGVMTNHIVGVVSVTPAIRCCTGCGEWTCRVYVWVGGGLGERGEVKRGLARLELNVSMKWC